MKIRVLRGYDCYEPGQVFEDWPAGMCEILISRGLIEQITDETVERAVEDVQVERADATPRVKPKTRK